MSTARRESAQPNPALFWSPLNARTAQQTVHIVARTSAPRMGYQSMPCITCKRNFVSSWLIRF